MEEQKRRKAEFKQKQADKQAQKQKEDKEHRERLAALKAAGRRESSVKELIQAHREGHKKKNQQKAEAAAAEGPEVVIINPELEARRLKREAERTRMRVEVRRAPAA